MQDRYAGDVGDFAKYGLLRHLLRASSHDQLRLGVIWYLVDDESGNSDGRHTSYLHDDDMNACDPDLHRAMADLVSSGVRTVAAVQRIGILPQDRAIYFSERLPPVSGNPRLDSSSQLAARKAWFARAQDAVADVDLVFLDPDNGLEIASIPYSARRAGKYVYVQELRALATRDQTPVLYQHHDRSAPTHVQVARVLKRLQLEIPDRANIIAATFRKGSVRTFFILPAERHRKVIEDCVRGIQQGPWGAYFSICRIAAEMCA